MRSGKEVRALVVEIKDKPPAVRAKGKAKQKGARKTAQTKSKATKQ